LQLPSFLPAKERVNERSDVRVSQPRRILPPMHGGEFTHPGFASLSDPLFAARKEGKKGYLNLRPSPQMSF